MTSNARRSFGQSRAVWPPQPGFFAFRLVKNGWRVPARILFDGENWIAEIDGELCDPHSDPAYAPMLSAVWHGGHKIPQRDYDWLVGLKAWARANDPDHPCLHPRRPIDPGQLQPITPRIPVRERTPA
jgi:hypothetical protein